MGLLLFTAPVSLSDGDDQWTLIDKPIRNQDSLIQQAARIIPQIQDQSSQFTRVLFLQFFDMDMKIIIRYCPENS